MRIYSRRAFLFEKDGESCKVKSLDFSEVPDWVKTTEIFKMGVKSNLIEVVSNKKQQKRLENNEDPKRENTPINNTTNNDENPS